MGRTSTEITQKEKDAFHNFCTEHRIVTDDEVGRANGDLIGEYIVLTWKEDITPRTLAVALDKLRDRIVFYSEAEWQLKQIADEDPWVNQEPVGDVAAAFTAADAESGSAW